MKILILGANGQLGTALTNLFIKQNVSFTTADLPDFDITNHEIITQKIKEINPNIIINAAGYTNVKRAEIEFDRALQINAVSLKKLSEICNKNNIYLCHISTDYVFDGTKNTPYLENDKTKPVNCYGLSKELGEKIIQNYCNDHVIVRTAALYGKSKIKSANIVDKIISFARKNEEISFVEDEFTSPTFSEDLAKQIHKILQNGIKGIVHATSQGECNWFEFGKYLLDIMNIKVKMNRIKSADFSQDLKKPLYSVLENYRLKSLKLNLMPTWQEALDKYLKNQ
ncbi:MAG: dTDP-4-dehydrorhamnose reductase [Candidatus Cloacimonetes bacterium]|nr:dTDP-4-dehydrorhamnose reductase [Candidatus Cloacimonadota bacterium]MCF7884802.1 dTDP-4-dehydrorhamnose reductase [Candidatus Cloacimonadota bacterium]